MITGIYPFGLPIALSLVGYNSLLTGIFVLLKRRDKVGFRYFVFALSVFAWGVGVSFMMNNSLEASVAQAWGRFGNASAVLIPPVWLHFVLAYTEQENLINKILNTFTYLVAFAILPFAGSRWFVSEFREMVGIKFYPAPGVLYLVFTTMFFLIVAYSFWVLYRSWRQAKSSEKREDYKLLFLAQLYGFVTGSLSFLPVYKIPLPQYNLLVMPIWQFLLAYTMVRYRLFDLEKMAQVIQKDKLAALGLLSASINHEIKNPLFVIQGHAETLLKSMTKESYIDLPESERRKRIEETLRRTTEQTSRIVEIAQRLTDFSKPASGEDAETISLNQAVENVLSFVGYGLKVDNIQVEKKIDPNLVLQGNPKELEQILLNLIINASQAMEGKRGEMRIEASEKNGKVIACISDTGPGIPPAQIKSIFQPFFTTKQSGTGLGLYITKQLVERNHGKISVTSDPGRGTTFTLEFQK